MRGSVGVLLVCAALITAGLGTAAAAAATAVPPCSVTFEGTVSDLWSNPANWSTGKVPGPSSDVCITKPMGLSGPIATGKIVIHSLQVDAGANVDFGIVQGVNHDSASVTISDVLIDTSDSIVLIHGTLAAQAIDNPGYISALHSATITSPALSNTGTIDADNGTLQLTDEPLQLRNTTLTGGTLEVDAGPLGDAIVLPFDDDISAIAAGTVDLPEGGAIENQSGGNALASLSSIGPKGTLIDTGPLTVTGNLVSRGTLDALSVHVRGNLVSGGLFEAEDADVRGDFTQTSTGTLAGRFGIAALSVGKTARLNGNFSLAVRKTCTPEDGEIVTAMTFAARHGTFTTTSSGFNVLYGPTSVRVQYEGPVNRTGCGDGG
jgi:hypothetical protein